MRVQAEIFHNYYITYPSEKRKHNAVRRIIVEKWRSAFCKICFSRDDIMSWLASVVVRWWAVTRKMAGGNKIKR
jgi:hypothetical protein